nr:histone-lysine N-methyltransferase SUV39H2-like isoform X2 [Vespula vulgaris]
MEHADIPGETSSTSEKRSLSPVSVQQRLKQPKVDEKTSFYPDNSEDSANLRGNSNRKERRFSRMNVNRRNMEKFDSPNNVYYKRNARCNSIIDTSLKYDVAKFKLKELRIVLEDIKYSSSHNNNVKLKITPKKDVWEVEKILNKKKINGVTSYLIKWKDWSDDYNTWEPLKNMTNCDEILKEFETSRTKLFEKLKKKIEFYPTEQDVYEFLNKIQQEGQSIDRAVIDESTFYSIINNFLKLNHVRKDKEMANIKTNILRYMLYDLRREQLDLLKDWENEMNSISKGKPSIFVENLMDLEGPPEDFFYIEDYLPGEEVVIPEDPPIGCDCVNCSSNTKCCSVQSDSIFPYTSKGKIRVKPGTPIYECNKQCKCDSTCPNRVIQRGAYIKFCIFKTKDGRGWGVKTLQNIKKGSFVTQYVGEVISSEEADKRGKEYDAAGRTYLFDLDYNETDDQCLYTVDAAVYGNISHFINHSCDPNLAVYGVWINCLDPNLPKLALFATRDIEKNEEITFDYMFQPLKTTRVMQNDIKDSRIIANKVLCKCGAKNCRKYLF